jgi:hypothetical protein
MFLFVPRLIATRDKQGEGGREGGREGGKKENTCTIARTGWEGASAQRFGPGRRWCSVEAGREERRKGEKEGTHVPAELLAQNGREHRDDFLDQVDGGTASGRLVVQGGVLAHEEGDVSNVHPEGGKRREEEEGGEGGVRKWVARDSPSLK